MRQVDVWVEKEGDGRPGPTVHTDLSTSPAENATPDTDRQPRQPADLSDKHLSSTLLIMSAPQKCQD